MKENRPVSKIIAASLITILAKLGGILKVSFIFGSFAAFFSISSMLLPLSGAFGGILGSSLLFGAGLLLRIFTGSVLSFKILAYHIPGYFASAYWARPTKWLSIALPLLCMVLFLAHPVGFAAAPYAFYWFIPVMVACLPVVLKYNIPFVPMLRRAQQSVNPLMLGCRSKLVLSPSKGLRNIQFNSIFMHSLSSTFIAHAVGSVIWLYATPMTPEFWYALIPMVAVERLVIAIGMTFAHRVITYLLNHGRTVFSYAPLARYISE